MAERTTPKLRPPAVPESGAPAARPSNATAAAREFAIEAARVLSDDKCTDIVVLDVRTLSHVIDYIVIGSGTSDRQMRGSLKNVEELGEKKGYGVFRSTSDDRASWLLADFVDVIAHVFEPNIRAHYDLEMLWGDAPRVEWERAAESPKPRKTRGTTSPSP